MANVTEALEAISATELTAGEGQWEYGVMPGEEMPAEQNYRHRAMRPQA